MSDLEKKKKALRALNGRQKQTLERAVRVIQGYKSDEEVILAGARVKSLLDHWRILLAKAENDFQVEAIRTLWEVVDLGKFVTHVFQRVYAAFTRALVREEAGNVECLGGMLMAIIAVAKECDMSYGTRFHVFCGLPNVAA